MAATLKDVALRAGVSIKTVSNVVHGYVHVTEEVRERVRTALEELHYQPNLPARYLRNGRAHILALAVPYVKNPYFSEIGNAVIEAATTQSYTVLLDQTDGERAKESLVINGMHPHIIDGVILSPLALEAEDLLPQEVQVPLVLLGERLLHVPYDHIVIDNIAAAHLATSHLVSLGRRRIAAIGAQEVLAGETARLRLQGYSKALLDAGQLTDASLIVQASSYERAEGIQAMHRLLELETPPDAVFCFNDLLALGAMRALYEAGKRIPEDVAVIGFDDIEDARFATPALTTIAPDKTTIGKLAVSFLLSRIDGTRTGPPEQVHVPFRLIVRESTVGRAL